MFYCYLLKYVFIFYFKGRFTEKEGKTERSSTRCFTPSLLVVPRTGWVQSKQPGASSGSLKWVQGPKVLDHPLMLS